MKTFVGLVVVALLGFQATLGGGATCLGRRESKEPELELDFKGLSEYLGGKIATDEPDANLGQMRADLVSLEPERVRKAAELSLKLSEASQCDDELLVLIRQAQEAGLRVTGGSRVEKVLKAHLNQLLETCLPHIRESLGPKLQERNIVQYLKEFGGQLGLDKNELHYMLAAHAKEDPNVRCDGFKNMQRDQFDSIFDTHLERPCHQLVSLFGALAEGYEAAHGMYLGSNTDYQAYDGRRPEGMLTVIKAMGVCRDVLNMTASKKTKMWKKFCATSGYHGLMNKWSWASSD